MPVLSGEDTAQFDVRRASSSPSAKVSSTSTASTPPPPPTLLSVPLHVKAIIRNTTDITIPAPTKPRHQQTIRARVAFGRVHADTVLVEAEVDADGAGFTLHEVVGGDVNVGGGGGIGMAAGGRAQGAGAAAGTWARGDGEGEERGEEEGEGEGGLHLDGGAGEVVGRERVYWLELKGRVGGMAKSMAL